MTNRTNKLSRALAAAQESGKPAAVFSSASDEWETPPDVFADLDAEFDFTLDAAASHTNHLCPQWFGPDHRTPQFRDALVLDWHAYADSVWLNPPYSRVSEFMTKAAHEAKHGVTTVMLIPSRTDTVYWHTYVWDDQANRCYPHVELRLLRGRLKFLRNGKPILDKSGRVQGAPFPSCLVIFRGY